MVYWVYDIGVAAHRETIICMYIYIYTWIIGNINTGKNGKYHNCNLGFRLGLVRLHAGAAATSTNPKPNMLSPNRTAESNA